MTSFADSQNHLAQYLDGLLTGFASVSKAWWTRLSVTIFVLYGLLVSLVPFQYPEYNWDMLAYLAAAQEKQITDPAELHATVYGQMRAVAPENDYDQLVGKSDYRIRQANDVDAFSSMLPMYRVKAGYVEAVRFLAPLTGPVAGIRWINTFSIILLLGFCLAWLRDKNALVLAAPVAGLIGLSGLAIIARLGTPDLLGAALIMGGFWCHSRRSEIPAALLLLAAFFVRPDIIVFIAAALVVGLAMGTRPYGIGAAFLVSLLSYGPLTSQAGHIGWWSHMWFSSVAYVPTLEGFSPEFSIPVYVKAFVLRFVRSIIEGGWPILLGLAVLWAFTFRQIGLRFERRDTALAIACVLAVAGKFVLFPLQDARLYFPLSILPMIVLLVMSRQLIPSGKGRDDVN